MAPAYSGDLKHPGSQGHPVIGNGQALTYGSDDSHGWTLPQRSMSYSQVERNPQQFMQQHVASHDYHAQGTPYAYPAPLNLRGNSMGTTTAPLSAPLAGQPGAGYGYPPVWNPAYGVQPAEHDVDASSGMFGGQWYSEPGELQKVDEEHAASLANYPPGYYAAISGRGAPG